MTDVLTRLTSTLAERYRVERELGAGGMATVYLAHDLRHERDVAIKVLHPDLGAALGGERFLAEIRTTARLQHPHILPLLDSGEANPAIHKASGVGASVTQVISVGVKGDKIECQINGQTVGSYDKSAAVGANKLKSTDGVYGVRFGHNTEAVVKGLTVVKSD